MNLPGICYWKSGNLQLYETFADLKREGLLLILLKSQTGLATVLFDLRIPDKLDLDQSMKRSFRFNISIERFAFLTARSKPSFKRDFQKAFGTTPGSWLKKKRLDEAYLQSSQCHKRPSDVYPEVGFEDLSHFSHVFKKQFAKAPSQFAL